jgi:PTH1 family peptidyl-tRNA hydrolase
VVSIIGTLGTEEFVRVKLGIGRPTPEMPTENYVLTHFPASEAENVAILVEQAGEAVATLVEHGLAVAQNRFHGVSADEV